MDHVACHYEWSFDLDHFENNHSGAPDGVQNRIENGVWHVLDLDDFNGIRDESYRLYADRRGLAHGMLKDEEIIAALSYIKSTWPNDVRQIHDDYKLNNAMENSKSGF
jgi:hypothetical protein